MTGATRAGTHRGARRPWQWRPGHRLFHGPRILYDPVPLTQTMTVLNEQNPAIDKLFAATVEATQEAVINALFVAHSMEGSDGHRVEALPIDETLAILRRFGA